MTITEKVAYLKGLSDGLGIDTEKSKEGKLISVIIDILEEMGMSIEDLEENATALGEELDAVSDDLADVEAQAGEDVSSLLLPVDSMFESSPPVRLTPRQERACRCGAAFSLTLAPGTYRLYGASEFLALGRCDGTRMQTIKSFFEVN